MHSIYESFPDMLMFFQIQEFGDSARARKLYEQDSDDDNDEELEINIKLEQGKKQGIP